MQIAKSRNRAIGTPAEICTRHLNEHKQEALLFEEIYSYLTLRLLMSYIYMEHLFLMFLDHTQRRTTVGRTRPEESYRLWCVVVCDLETSRIGAPYIYI